jgi:hypothetical protein
MIWLIKSRRIRWVGCVAHSGGKRGAQGFWWGDLSERDHLEELGVDVRMILKWIIRKWDGKAWTILIWLGIETGGGHF